MSHDRTRSLGESSAKYGPCEVCSRNASEVFIRSTGAASLFGHDACVQSVPAANVKAVKDVFYKTHHGVGR